jgi:phosphatidylglycerol:prolipoprotein diacylglycerol transferase
MIFAIPFPDIDPALFTAAIGGYEFSLRWYALAYIAGLLLGWRLMVMLMRRPQLWPDHKAPMSPAQPEDLLTWMILSVILGGRLGYVLFYKPVFYLYNPGEILRVWEGGMSFHGGFIGVLVAMELYRRKLGCRFWELTDFIAPLVPLGLAAGRLGNFINAELWGAPSTLPWAMKLSCEQFPADRYVDFAGPLCFSARHPTQLYEMLFEGIVLFIALWLISAKPRPVMTISGWFLLLYGLARSGVELIRLPDAHIGYLMNTDWLTRGIVLSLPMIIVGVILLVVAKRSAGNAAIS